VLADGAPLRLGQGAERILQQELAHVRSHDDGGRC
jgi:hypothetical protein